MKAIILGFNFDEISEVIDRLIVDLNIDSFVHISEARHRHTLCAMHLEWDLLKFSPEWDKISAGFSVNLTSEILATVHTESFFSLMEMMRRLYSSEPPFSAVADRAIRMLGFWLNFLISYQPSIVVFSSFPHEGFDYALYLVCKLKNIKTVFLYPLPVRSKFSAIHAGVSLEDVGLQVSKLASIKSTSQTRVSLQTLNEGMVSRHYTHLLEPNSSNSSRLTRADGELVECPSELLENYKGRVNSGCVLFAMHYQPECSTSPLGGKFTFQQYSIDWLLSAFRTQPLVIVKEHPRVGRLNNSSYIRALYSNNESVKYLDGNVKPESLFSMTDAVATVSGSIGFEAFLQGLPVICFGSRFYRYAEGVYIPSQINGKEINIDALSGASFDYRCAFLDSLNSFSLPGTNNGLDLVRAGVSISENCENIAKLIVMAVKHDIYM